MASTQKKTPHLTEALGGENSPTGTLEPDHKMNPLHSGMAGSYKNPSAGAVDRRTYLGINSEATPGVAQTKSLLYAPELGSSYSNQPGNNVAINKWNYGGYYRPGAMCFAEYGDTYPSNARPLRNSADLSSCAISSKLRHREQKSSCSFDQRFTASKRHDSETDAKSFVNPHALIQPYFPSDELRHQPASYPRLSCEQNLSFLDFACRFPNPIPSSHSAVPHANLMQPELGGVPLTTHSDQYPVVAQPYFQQQVSSLIPGDVPAQNCSYSDNVASYFPQPSLGQLMRELHTNPPPTYEGVQASNRRFSSNGFFESNDSNLRRLSDICATSSPFNHLGTVPEHETIFGNFRECSENDVYTRVTLGPAMNSEGSLSYGIKGPPRSCMFRRRADIFRSHASGSSEKLDFEKLLELPQTGNDIKPLATITEIDVVGDECKKEPAWKASCSEVLPKRRGPRECECTVCGKMLARASTLKIHMRQHTGDRPFKCVTCAKTFAQAGLLQSHRRTHTGERPFTCSFCQKTFSHSSALKTHMRTHTGERPHKCQVAGCNMAFGDSSTLSKHARTHTGERPYCCDICDKRFTQSGNMHKHKKSVHNIKNSSSCRSKSGFKKDMSVETTQTEIGSESSTSQSENTLHALLSN